MKELLRSTIAYRAIKAESARGEHSHASLVVFPDGVYLRALLKECAKAYFGAEDGSRTAELIDLELYSDCLFFPSAEGKLTAEDCARIVEEGLLRPVEGERKLFVLDRFHTATPLIQNKLLKLLEEPPAGVGFLLGAEAEFPVLPTVLSRVKKYHLSPFSEEEIARALARAYPAAENAAQCAAASGGIYSVAETLLSGGGEEFRLAEEFLSLREPERFCREAGERKNKRELLSAIGSLLREMLFCAAGQPGRGAAAALAKSYPMGAIIAALELVFEAEKEIQFNANFASCLYKLALGVKEEREKWQRLS